MARPKKYDHIKVFAFELHSLEHINFIKDLQILGVAGEFMREAFEDKYKKEKEIVRRKLEEHALSMLPKFVERERIEEYIKDMRGENND